MHEFAKAWCKVCMIGEATPTFEAWDQVRHVSRY